jgi:hypothetical protein
MSYYGIHHWDAKNWARHRVAPAPAPAPARLDWSRYRGRRGAIRFAAGLLLGFLVVWLTS